MKSPVIECITKPKSVSSISTLCSCGGNARAILRSDSFVTCRGRGGGMAQENARDVRLMCAVFGSSFNTWATWEPAAACPQAPAAKSPALLLVA